MLNRTEEFEQWSSRKLNWIGVQSYHLFLKVRLLPIFDNRHTRRFNDWANEKMNAYDQRKTEELLAGIGRE